MRTMLILAAGLLSGSSSLVSQNAAPLPLVAAAQAGDVEAFAQALAAQGIAVGVVFVTHTASARSSSPPTSVPLKPGELESAIAAFHRASPDYAVEMNADGTLLIAPRAGGGCKAELQSRRRSIETSGSVLEVVYRLYRTWTDDTSQYLPPGLVGDSRDAGHAARFRANVSVSVTDGSLHEALNSMLRQVSGLGWIVRELPPTATAEPGESFRCNLSLFDARARLLSSWTMSVAR